MTAFTVAGRRGRYTFGASTLHASGAMRCGSVHTGAAPAKSPSVAAAVAADDGSPGADFDLEVTDRRRIGVVARSGGRPVVTLHPDGARIPGSGGPAHWSVGRNSATLTRGDDRIEVRAGWPGSPLRVEVVGDWPDLDLLVLTVCFAVLARRRQRLITTIAVVGATSSARG